MSKKTRAALRRSLFTLSLVLVVAFAAVGGTIAWLTSTATVTNTFSVGSVEITLDELPVNEYGEVEEGDRRTENDYKLLPGHTYTKDPTVHVTAGSEECWVFVQITNPIDEIVVSSVVEVDGEEQNYGTIENQIVNNDWVALDGVDGVYYYKETVDTREATDDLDLVVFEYFTISNDANVSEYDGLAIEIVAYAIQADGVDDAADAWDKLFAE